MSHNAGFTEVSSLRMALSAALLIGSITACSVPPNQWTQEETSKCLVKPNPEFQATGVAPFPRLPLCNIPIKPFEYNPPVRFLADVWDANRQLQGRGYWAQSEIRDALGVRAWISLEQFLLTPIGQPQGMEAVRFDFMYTPATAGYVDPGRVADTGVVRLFSALNSPTAASAAIALKFEPEGAASLTGPSSLTWGDDVEYSALASNVRRPASVTWKVDGSSVASGSIGWTTLQHSLRPVFPTAGRHTVSAVVTSATGTVSTVSRSVLVNVPPECAGGGGGGLAVRSAPGSTTSGESRTVPWKPRSTSCPPS